jgi:hypothetical protein
VNPPGAAARCAYGPARLGPGPLCPVLDVSRSVGLARSGAIGGRASRPGLRIRSDSRGWQPYWRAWLGSSRARCSSAGPSSWANSRRRWTGLRRAGPRSCWSPAMPGWARPGCCWRLASGPGAAGCGCLAEAAWSWATSAWRISRWWTPCGARRGPGGGRAAGWGGDDRARAGPASAQDRPGRARGWARGRRPGPAPGARRGAGRAGGPLGAVPGGAGAGGSPLGRPRHPGPGCLPGSHAAVGSGDVGGQLPV